MNKMKAYKKIILSVLVNAILFWFLNKEFNDLIGNLFNGNFEVIGDLESFLFLSILFSCLNWFIKPLLELITIPIKFLTLGIFGLAINAFMLLLLEFSVNFLQVFDTKMIISDWKTYFVLAIILSLANGLIHWFED